MGDHSAIEWTEATWNPVTGCTKVSPGCDHCYAERIVERFHGKGSFGTVVRSAEKLYLPMRWRKPRRIFVNSMSDLFHDDVPDSFIANVFSVMARTPRHTYQVLTKRHGRMRSLLSRPSFRDNLAHLAPWPVPNVWLGVSVEDQTWADIRIPALLDTPAAVRWISAEPLLGPVNLYKWVQRNDPDGECQTCGVEEWTGEDGHPKVHYCEDGVCTVVGGPDCDEAGEETGAWCPGPVKRYPLLDWVVVGGESGPGARPMHPDWPRSIRNQCTAAGVPFFFKQWGEWVAPFHMTDATFMSWDCEHGTSAYDREQPWRVGKKRAGRLLDGRAWDEYPAAVTP